MQQQKTHKALNITNKVSHGNPIVIFSQNEICPDNFLSVYDRLLKI